MKGPERITREELLNALSLSMDDLDKVTGGDATELHQCLTAAENKQNACKEARGGNIHLEYDCEKVFANDTMDCVNQYR